jgi:hypothetical protein
MRAMIAEKISRITMDCGKYKIQARTNRPIIILVTFT